MIGIERGKMKEVRNETANKQKTQTCEIKVRIICAGEMRISLHSRARASIETGTGTRYILFVSATCFGVERGSGFADPAGVQIAI
jgi:hypothetical protein